VEAVRLIEPVVLRRRWLDTRMLFFRSPSVPMGDIFSGSDDSLVKVWSVSASKEVASLAGHTNFAFSPDGQYFVSGSRDNLVKVWS
jgi:WD40 repeat protein